MESASQIAKRLLDEGYAKFIGGGLVIEQAQKNGSFNLEIGGESKKSEFYDWRDAMIIKPIVKDEIPYTKPPLLDFIYPELCDAPAGSSERIEALASHYDGQGENGDSAFFITDNLIAERIARALHEYDGLGMANGAYDSKHHRKSTVRE